MTDAEYAAYLLQVQQNEAQANYWQQQIQMEQERLRQQQATTGRGPSLAEQANLAALQQQLAMAQQQSQMDNAWRQQQLAQQQAQFQQTFGLQREQFQYLQQQDKQKQAQQFLETMIRESGVLPAPEFLREFMAFLAPGAPAPPGQQIPAGGIPGLGQPLAPPAAPVAPPAAPALPAPVTPPNLGTIVNPPGGAPGPLGPTLTVGTMQSPSGTYTPGATPVWTGNGYTWQAAQAAPVDNWGGATAWGGGGGAGGGYQGAPITAVAPLGPGGAAAPAHWA